MSTDLFAVRRCINCGLAMPLASASCTACGVQQPSKKFAKMKFAFLFVFFLLAYSAVAYLMTL
jgi:hypothetical protein